MNITIEQGAYKNIYFIMFRYGKVVCYSKQKFLLWSLFYWPSRTQSNISRYYKFGFYDERGKTTKNICLVNHAPWWLLLCDPISLTDAKLRSCACAYILFITNCMLQLYLCCTFENKFLVENIVRLFILF